MCVSVNIYDYTFISFARSKKTDPVSPIVKIIDLDGRICRDSHQSARPILQPSPLDQHCIRFKRCCQAVCGAEIALGSDCSSSSAGGEKQPHTFDAATSDSEREGTKVTRCLPAHFSPVLA